MCGAFEEEPPSREEIADEALHVKAAVSALLAGLRHYLKLCSDRAFTREIVDDVHRDICATLRSFAAK
jgi:hypothetical protein